MTTLFGTKPFDRTVLYELEKFLEADFNAWQSTAMRSVLEVIDRFLSVRSSQTDSGGLVTPDGFFGNGFRVVPPSPAAMTVKIKAGLGLFVDASEYTEIGGVAGLDDRGRLKPLVLVEDETISLDSAPSVGFARRDIIEVAIGRRLTDADATRKQLEPSTGKYAPPSVALNKTLTYSLGGQTGRVAPGGGDSTALLSYKVGTAVADGGDINTVVWGSVAGPAVSPGYTKIADVLITGGLATIPDARYVLDWRPMLLGPYGGGRIAGQIVRDVATPIVSISQLTGPPGAQVVAAMPNLLNVAPYTHVDVYLFAGGGRAGAGPVFSVPSAQVINAVPSSIIVAPLQLAQVTGYTQGLYVDAALQLKLRSADAYPSPFNVAIGTPYAKFRIEGVEVPLGGGAPGYISNPDPIAYGFGIDVQS